MIYRLLPLAALGLASCAPVNLAVAQDQPRSTGLGDHAVYEDKARYPVIDGMAKAKADRHAEARAQTEAILSRITAEKKARDGASKVLRPDVSGLWKPSGPDAFATQWHFPPTHQDITGTCWSFASTSFLESEMKRLHGKEIKLSEMWTAYWEYVDKAQGFLRTRGNTYLGEGSEVNAFQRLWIKRGVVPRSVYDGCLSADGRFDHSELFEMVESYLKWCQERGFWEEDFILAQIRLILDRTLGRPPEQFEYEGETYTPATFLSEVCRVVPTDYVALMSTMAQPFGQRVRFDVPDNWWHDETYLNVPLDTWFGALRSALYGGFSVAMGGDVSEPGHYGAQDVAFVPSFDIPREFIDQSSREHRIVNETTFDDHAIHCVGHLREGDEEWFLIKDSWRSSELGRHNGYYMYREDYVRLKMLTLTMHKDAVAELLAGVASE